MTVKLEGTEFAELVTEEREEWEDLVLVGSEIFVDNEGGSEDETEWNGPLELEVAG